MLVEDGLLGVLGNLPTVLVQGCEGRAADPLWPAAQRGLEKSERFASALCLSSQLAVLREFKTLRDEEKERVEGRERMRKEKQERAREAEERERREKERQDIVAWRRNRIEVANLSRMQVNNCCFLKPTHLCHFAARGGAPRSSS